MSYMMDQIRKENTFKSKGNFEIAVSPDMFRMLSVYQYSNPIRAIVREYSTNAKDSQVEAGVDKPFDIQLPTHKNPMFKIRDYGTGMSPERVETVFQTYGASTKRETNQSTGKFGIGAKCAFAYINSFAVISYYDGMVYKYLVVKNDEDVPELLTDGQPCSTDEPNGVKIQFAVDVKDVNAFTKAAQEVYPYFDITPNFIGDVQPIITHSTYSMEGDEGHFTWKVKEGNTDSQIIMGCNVYPLGDELRQFNDESIDYFVEIDAFEPTPSREALTWSDKDIKQFKAMRDLVRRSIYKKFKKEAVGLTEFQELKLFCDYADTYVGKIVRDLDPNPKFKWYPGNIEFDTYGPYEIKMTYQYLRILSKSVSVRKITPGERTSNFVLKKTVGRSEIGELGGVEAEMKNISEDSPLEILLFDVKGINSVINYLPKGTIVIGSVGCESNEADLKTLTDFFDKEKIPYTVSRFSEVKPTLGVPKTETVKTTVAASDRNVGVFDYQRNSVFIGVTNLSDYQYYVAFDDETTFKLKNFFEQSTRDQGWYAQSDKLIDRKLREVSYAKITKALNFKDTSPQICYIRPRFVELYSKNLKSFQEVCTAKFVKKFKDNWLGFMSFLYEEWAYSRSNFSDSKMQLVLTYEAQELLQWLKSRSTAWEHLYLRYPLCARISETICVHRYNYKELTHRNCHFYLPYGQSWLERSSEAEAITSDYRILTQWMFSPAFVADLYKPWTDRLNEEARSILRTYPYLFKKNDDLLYMSLISKEKKYEHENTN